MSPSKIPVDFKRDNNNNNNNEIYIALNPNTRFAQSVSHGSILSRKGSPEKMRLQERLEGEEVSASHQSHRQLELIPFELSLRDRGDSNDSQAIHTPLCLKPVELHW
jgi:hypothetical protein